MTRPLSVLLYLLSIVLSLSGCSESSERTLPREVRISPTMMRVTDLNFETGDCIGLTIQRGLEAYAENVMMTYNGAEFTASGLVWYAGPDDLSTLTAYYPYLKAGITNQFTVMIDQQSASNFSGSDLLAAVKTNVKPATSAVKMFFHHLLTRISVQVTNSTDSKVVGVTIGGSIPDAAVDFPALKATAKTGGTAVEIKAREVTPETLYRVVLVPQHVSLVVTVFMDDGTNRSKTLTAAALEGGKAYDVSVAVSRNDLQVALSGDIQDWVSGGTLGGTEGGGGNNPGGGNENPDEEGGNLNYQGETYKTVKIGERTWMAENMRYVPNQGLIGSGIWYPARAGEAGMDSDYVRQRGMLYSYAVVTGSSSGAVVQGICPTGWHIPSRAELSQLTSAPADFYTPCGFWNTSLGNYGPDTKGYLLSSETTEDLASVYCLNISNSSIMTLMAGFGLSLRCVKDPVQK